MGWPDRWHSQCHHDAGTCRDLIATVYPVAFSPPDLTYLSRPRRDLPTRTDKAIAILRRPCHVLSESHRDPYRGKIDDDIVLTIGRYEEVYGDRDFLRPARYHVGPLASTEGRLAEAWDALEALMTVECTDAAGASTSQSVPDSEVASHREQLAAVVARAEVAERNLTARSAKLQSAITQASLADLPREAAELRVMLTVERWECEHERGQWAEEHSL
ncbi:hypothetical protein Taro_017462 [Colocasia esculenta]|uniref:Uncharacterized protein n=1 Tax=Colocasia esculenta TaxID=4460 RepID=A0A843UN75_COLES|nr:hypothetical protein [Colocasia esculenta]